MDNKIKKYFEHRTIDPSTQAWDRLDSMLTVAEKPKKRFTIHYILAFAASLVIILVMFIGPSNEQLENIEVTNQVALSQNDAVNTEVKVMENEVVQTKDIIVENAAVKNVIKSKEDKSQSSLIVQNDKKSDDISIVEYTLITTTPENKTAQNLLSESIVSSEIVSPKVEVKKSTFKIDPEALLASITNVKSAPNKTEVASNTKRRRIDPNTLLDEAENVVAKGFLVRALSSLKETSDEILTSVSNRNQEKQR